MTHGISIRNVSFSYPNGTFSLKNISLDLEKGGFLGITGVNGSGKSTFSFLLNGLIPHLVKGKFSGEVTIDGIPTNNNNVSYWAKKVGFLFQNPDFSLFNLTVTEELEFGLKNLKMDKIGERIRKALHTLDLDGYAGRDPQTLSFGQKQKVALACILALETDYLVLDEPIAQLDYKSSKELYGVLKKLNNLGKTVVVVEHDTDFLYRFTKEVVILDRGKIRSFGPTQKVLSDRKLLNKLGVKVPYGS